ncbi:MAG: twin-arginine translocase TatA/TatE family subunit [Campylobacteraceae bacterium]|jgi:sec-independent protein translocase protein TatA|nr:twin-arginine translocase TatA/TatE family subunit [Campylobacteraceae bacterium]
MFSSIGVPGLIIIFLIIIVLFGGKRIAEVAKGLGTGVKNFKDAIKEDEKTEEIQSEPILEEKIAVKKTAAKKSSSTKTKTASK